MSGAQRGRHWPAPVRMATTQSTMSRVLVRTRLSIVFPVSGRQRDDVEHRRARPRNQTYEQDTADKDPGGGHDVPLIVGAAHLGVEPRAGVGGAIHGQLLHFTHHVDEALEVWSRHRGQRYTTILIHIHFDIVIGIKADQK
jgi:hypothetical protein